MFEPLDSAAVEFCPTGGAIITRLLSPAEQERLRNTHSTHSTQSINQDVALAWIREELRRYESLWDIRVQSQTRQLPNVDPHDPRDPLGQRRNKREPSLCVHFTRLSDGTRKYMLTVDDVAHEIPTIDEVIQQLNNLYAKALVEQR